MDNADDLTGLAKLQSSKDFPVVEALVAHLRRRSPATVPASELALAVNRPKRQIYGLIKFARRLLALTTGEALANLRNVGYRISNQPRAHMFESIKSGNRADGHLAQEVASFRRVNRNTLTSTEDVDLYVTQQARIALGQARLSLSENIAPAMRRLAANAALASTAQRDALTPWKEIGLDDPDDGDVN